MIGIGRLSKRLHPMKMISKALCQSDYDLDFFTGRRVAIVGPADSVLHRANGAYVDTFDIVVRINNSLPLKPSLLEFTGSKTTALFHGLDETPTSGCGPIRSLHWRKAGVKKVYYPLAEEQVIRNVDNFHRKNYGLLPICTVGNREYRELKRKIQAVPTTGFGAIYAILSARPSHLFITGFTFFRTRHIGGYKDELKDVEEVWRLIKRFGNHRPDHEFSLFKDLVENYAGSLELDEFLETEVGFSHTEPSVL